jgi:hypothetical protein
LIKLNLIFCNLLFYSKNLAFFLILLFLDILTSLKYIIFLLNQFTDFLKLLIDIRLQLVISAFIFPLIQIINFVHTFSKIYCNSYISHITSHIAQTPHISIIPIIPDFLLVLFPPLQLLLFNTLPLVLNLLVFLSAEPPMGTLVSQFARRRC